VRQVIRAAGEIFPTFGMIGLLFISYLIWGTALRADSAQRQLSNELNQGRASRRVLAATGHTVNVASITRRRAEQAGRLGDLAKIALPIRLLLSHGSRVLPGASEAGEDAAAAARARGG
jgi:hypothetical protein